MQVWKLATSEMASPIARTENLDRSFQSWLSDKGLKSWTACSSIYVYKIWWARNVTTIQGSKIPQEVLAGSIVKLTKEYELDMRKKKLRILVMPILDDYIPWGFFRWCKPRGASLLWSWICFVPIKHSLFPC